MITLTDFGGEIVLPDNSRGSLEMVGLFLRLPGHVTSVIQCGSVVSIRETDLVVRGQNTLYESCAAIAPREGETPENRYLVDELTPFHLVMREDGGKCLSEQ